MRMSGSRWDNRWNKSSFANICCHFSPCESIAQSGQVQIASEYNPCRIECGHRQACMRSQDTSSFAKASKSVADQSRLCFIVGFGDLYIGVAT